MDVFWAATLISCGYVHLLHNGLLGFVFIPSLRFALVLHLEPW